MVHATCVTMTALSVVDSIISITEDAGRRKAAAAAFRARYIVPERVRPKCHCLLRSRARPHDLIALSKGGIIFSLFAPPPSRFIRHSLALLVSRRASEFNVVLHAVTRRELKNGRDGWYIVGEEGKGEENARG